MHSIHITTARKIFEAPEPVTISFWKKDGTIVTWEDVVPLRYRFREGTRTFKSLRSNQIRTVRDICIFSVNDMEVFL